MIISRNKKCTHFWSEYGLNEWKKAGTWSWISVVVIRRRRCIILMRHNSVREDWRRFNPGKIPSNDYLFLFFFSAKIWWWLMGIWHCKNIWLKKRISTKRLYIKKLWIQEIKNKNISKVHCFRANQATIAAVFWACFLVLACSPEKLIPASSTVQVKTGAYPGPVRTVVYEGSFIPALWAVSWSRFL